MTRMKSKLLLFVPIALLLSFLLALIPQAADRSAEGTEESRVSLTSDDSDQEMTNVIVDGKSDYTVLFASADGIQADNDFAKDLTTAIKDKYGVTIKYRADTAVSKHGTYEILLGKTNRLFSIELYNEVCAASVNNSLVWVIAEQDGKIAFVANCAEAFEMGMGDMLALLGDDGFAVPTGKKTVNSMTRADYEAYVKAEQEKKDEQERLERQQRIEELKKLISEFEYSQFGDAPTTSMTGDGYGKPTLYPNAGEHPRVNVTAAMLPDIIAYMEENEATYTVKEFWKLVNTEYTGILPPAQEYTSGRKGFHNMDEAGLAVIEAKAFAYLLTGDEYYAYEAVYAMKNYLVTIDIQWIFSDQCREFGRIIYCTAEVYDWCYDILTDEDKAQFIMACADIGSSRNQNTDFGNQIELGFPPTLGGVVSGHSSEHQALRDYLSMAIAIFDEDPTWYEWVGGLIYNYYVPFRNYYYQSGTYPQGINCYAGHRHNADLWSAWLLLCATGEIPYSDDLARVTRSFFENEAPDGTYFGTGDGGRPSSGSTFWQHAVITSALYGDATLRAQAYKFTNGFKKYTASDMSFSYSQMLILSAHYRSQVSADVKVDRFSESEPVCYLGSPLGQMTVRSQWNDENAAATFMKLGERATANHEHGDAGTFQIFYKGLYTGDTGYYDTYGSTHWAYYHQSTIAHNGLLISNPALIGDDPSNAASYFYSGSQRRLAETRTLETWLSSTYDTGKVTGVQWAYNSDGTTDYAYLGGSITEAYDSDTVSYVGRHMLTLYTGDEDVPMYFIVYDKITSVGENYTKTFLLHTNKEPVIDEATGTVTMKQKNGRLVLKSLVGGDSITAVGGEGMTFAINGRQCVSEKGEGSEWGRVEISPTADQKTHYLLNFMFVTDATSNATVETETITGEGLHGLAVDDTVIIFAESEEENNTAELNFTVEGTGLRRFLVMGMYAGTWNISVDGVSVAHSVSSEEGGMITFYAPAGNITISPGSNIAPANGGRIVYTTFGGVVPDDAPLVYEVGVPLTLPTNINNGTYDTFDGWYTSPNYEEETRVDVLVATEKGKITLYAKYKGVSINEDYEDITIDHNKTAQNGISYSGKTGSRFKTCTDVTGNTYMHVTKGDLDPQIDVTRKPSEYLYGETKLTLVIDLARDESIPLSSTCRLRGGNGAGDTIPYFTTDTSGGVKLGGQVNVMTLTETFQTLAVTFDFVEETLTGYDADGTVLAKIDITAPAASGANTVLEWLATLTSTVNWWIGGGETLLIDNFTVYAGGYTPKPVVIPDGCSKINYELNGGAFVGKPDRYYKEGEVALLEPNVVNGQDEFLGWYTTPDFQKGTMITEISAETRGEVTVYAKWAGKLFSADFEGFDGIEVDGKNQTVNGVDLAAQGKAGAIFRTEKDASGNTYVYWYKGTQDPQFKITNNLNSLNGSSVATIMLSLATVEGETPLAFEYRFRASSKQLTATNKANSITIFKTDTSGSVKLMGKTEIAKLNSDSFTKIIITIDFEAKTVTAYEENGIALAQESFEIDDYRDFLSGLDFPLYAYPNGGQSIKIDDISITASAYSPKETVVPSTMGKIDYMTNGGTLPDGYPKYYTKGESLELPIPTKKNATFLGWYKDADLTQPIKAITAEDTENFILYAAWQVIILDYDPNETDFNYAGKADGSIGGSDAGGMSFQTKGENSYFQTLTGDDGEKYLLWSKGSGDPQVNYGGTLSAAANNNLILTFQLSLAKNGDSDFIGFAARMRSTSVNGRRTEMNLLTVETDGSFNLYGTEGKVLVGQFGTEFKTLGMVADFGTGMFYGYDETGKKVCEAHMMLPTGMTAQEFYAAINADIFNLYAGGSQQTSVRIKRITIQTGNIYESDDASADEIKYELDGGTLPDGALNEYDSETGYTLHTPTRNGYAFGGWFTSSDFSADSKITEIAAGTTGTVKVYAKWSKIEKIVYELNGGELAENAPTEYVRGTATDLPEATLFGYEFEGWYTTSDFQEGTKVTSVPTDATGDFKVYARFVYNL